LETYKTVIWDWNGTLLDDVELCLSIVNELLADYDLPALTKARYQEIFDFPVRLYWERAGLDLERVDFQTVSSRFCERFECRLPSASLYPGATRVLHSARDAGISQFLLSNTEQTALTRLVAHYELSAHFDSVKGMRDTLAEGKLAGGSALLRAHSLDPDATLMVGDTSHDAEVARELGVDCVLIAQGHQAAGRLEGRGCVVVDSIGDLPALLRA
jgi:phosphoglycolate phosphatase